ncbi:MAG: hypothetical protein U0105_08830 [Candidatus Obscuribacterales bacterium]
MRMPITCSFPCGVSTHAVPINGDYIRDLRLSKADIEWLSVERITWY